VAAPSKTFTVLPLDILLEIAQYDDAAIWYALTGIPAFGRWTISEDGHNQILPRLLCMISNRPIILAPEWSITRNGRWLKTPAVTITLHLFRSKWHSFCLHKGRYEWYRHGLLHNEYGPALVERRADGTYDCIWYLRGQIVNPLCALSASELQELRPDANLG